MKLSIAACLFSGILLFSCDDAETESVNTLGTDVQFSMAEYFESGERTLSFKFLTQKDYPCINYRIKSNYQTEGESLVVSLSEVEGADVCLEAIAPAASFLDIGELATGDYPIIIKVGESLVNTGTLSVSPEAFELTMNEEQGLMVETPRLLRVPQGVIWGNVFASETGVAASVAEQLLSRLQSMGATSTMLEAGNYGYFSVDASGQMTNALGTSDQTESVFLLDYQGESSDLSSLVEEIASLYAGQVSFSLRTSAGDELKSW